MATTYLTPGVYVEEVPSSSATLTAGATAIAAFVGFTEKYPTDDPTDPLGQKPRLVTSWAQYEKSYGSFAPGIMLPHSVYGFFNNGGSLAYIVRIPHTQPAAESGVLELTSGDKQLGTAVEVTTVEPNANIVVSIAPEPPDESVDDAPPTFRLDVTENNAEKPVETFSGLTLTAGDRNIDTVVNAQSKKVKVTTKVDLSALDPTLASIPAGNYPIKPAPATPVQVPGKAFAGSETARQGINGLVIAEDVTMVIVPDLITACPKDEHGKPDETYWKTVQLALINHCEGQANRMAVLDAPPGKSPQQVKEWRESVGYSSPFATLYYPWIKVNNPAATNGDTEIMIPPSGHMAGIWSRTDNTRGVWKAPANEVVRGALDVEMNITKAEQGLLNPLGVNCIRPFGTRGIRVWGARTLAEESGEWRYINVRRLFNMIESTIMNGTQYAVFEPNDMTLWEGLKRTINAFLRGLWRDGALFGATAEQAFFVKCDNETNPPESIDQGKVVVEVGIAPVKPAEFVIFRIAQIKETSA